MLLSLCMGSADGIGILIVSYSIMCPILWILYYITILYVIFCGFFVFCTIHKHKMWGGTCIYEILRHEGGGEVRMR